MKRIPLFLLLALLLITNTAFAAVDLGVDELTLDPGETYEFDPIADGIVNWSISDESVLQFSGGEHIGVTALQPGTAVVFAMSEDRSEVDSCVVTVSGEAKMAAKSADLYYLQLTSEDLAKVNDPAVSSVLNIASDTETHPKGIGSLDGNEYKVLLSVKEGSAQKVADAADALGLAEVRAFDRVNMTALCGSANDIARLLVEYRDDILSVETDEVYTVEPMEESLVSKDVSHLEGNAETLSAIDELHKLGFTGEGQYVAVIDMGIDPNHAEFLDENGESRVAYQRCFSSGSEALYTTLYGKQVYKQTNSVCKSVDSGEPANAIYPKNFNHGTHVAGIAAGKSGVAPDAKIIAIQAFTEVVYYNLKEDGTPDYDQAPAAAGSLIYMSDGMAAMQFIAELIDEEGIVPAAVCMSYGSGAYPDYESYYADDYFSYFLTNGTIPCAAAMNNFTDGIVALPAASRYTFTVGALDDQTVPAVAPYSNHNQLVNILAPGTDILSAMYTESKTSNNKGNNAYDRMSGTSMATPLVSGTFALLRQMYPDYTTEELENFMIAVTDKSASRKEVSAPALSFEHISEYYIKEPQTADYAIAGGDSAVTVNLSADSEYDGYKAAVYNSADEPVTSEFALADQDRAVTFPGLTNDEIYRVKVWGYKEIKGTKFLSPCTHETEVTPAAGMAAKTIEIPAAAVEEDRPVIFDLFRLW